MKNYNLITIKYLAATARLDARIKLTSERLNTSVTLDRDYSITADNQALLHCTHDMRLNIIGKTCNALIQSAINNSFGDIR